MKTLTRLHFSYILLCCIFCHAESIEVYGKQKKDIQPQHLTTDMMEHLPISSYGVAGYICSSRPTLGWTLPMGFKQTGYRILMATSKHLLSEDKSDVWDSGPIMSNNSVAVPYAGESLKPETRYWWTIKVWGETKRKKGKTSESHYARPTSFTTAGILDSCFSHYPLIKSKEKPVYCSRTDERTYFYDFQKDAFAQITLRVTSRKEKDSITVHLGEDAISGHVNQKPQGSIRYTRYTIPLNKGTQNYAIRFRPDKRNTDKNSNESRTLPILMPNAIGEVYPFRYVEVEGVAQVKSIERNVVNVPFNENAALFTCSDSILNQVWELCKYSIKATSFTGIYVDGDRERIPYEADALINQLSHYTADKEYTTARRSIAHLIEHPTWPTEWILLTPRLAWLDYLYTGNDQLIKKYYHDLQAKAFIALRDKRGLISTRTGLLTDSVQKSVHFRGDNLRDIVDWPQGGAAGIEKEAGGEADGHEMLTYNTVVNAYHYDALHMMSLIAGALGKSADSCQFSLMAQQTAESINTLLWNEKKGAYVDGEGSTHCSQHSSMFPLAFDLVPLDRQQRVANHLESRKMGCSVYGAQFLLDALYAANRGTYAHSLLAGTGKRSWYNMIRMGSTITTEAWDNVFKPNLDWNHAWGAAASNIIARQLMGIQPLTPGFSSISIKPQPGGLDNASIIQPTPRGSVKVSFRKRADQHYDFRITVPANSTAILTLPTTGKQAYLDSGEYHIKEE